jgi:hypothetical protein
LFAVSFAYFFVKILPHPPISHAEKLIEQKAKENRLALGATILPSASQLCIELMYPPFYFTSDSTATTASDNVASLLSRRTTSLSDTISSEVGARSSNPSVSSPFQSVRSADSGGRSIPSSPTSALTPQKLHSEARDILGISYVMYYTNLNTGQREDGAKDEGLGDDAFHFENKIDSFEKLKVFFFFWEFFSGM